MKIYEARSIFFSRNPEVSEEDNPDLWKLCTDITEELGTHAQFITGIHARELVGTYCLLFRHNDRSGEEATLCNIALKPWQPFSAEQIAEEVRTKLQAALESESRELTDRLEQIKEVVS